MLGNRDSHEMLENHKMIEAEIAASKRQGSTERPDIQPPPSLKDIVNDAPKAARPQMPSPEEAAEFDVDNATPSMLANWLDRRIPDVQHPTNYYVMGAKPHEQAKREGILKAYTSDKIKPIQHKDILSTPTFDHQAVRDLSHLDTDWAVQQGYTNPPKNGKVSELVLYNYGTGYIPQKTRSADQGNYAQGTAKYDPTNPPAAEAHLHPSFEKGYGPESSVPDWAIMLQRGKPITVQYKKYPDKPGAIAVVELKNGVFQARWLNGDMTEKDNRALQRILNYYQAESQNILWRR